jgi:chemotaxis protein histidine kinase CheA
LAVSFDYLISKNITRKENCFIDGLSKKIPQNEFAEIQKRNINNELVDLLKRKADSLKAPLKSMGHLNIVKIVDRFEDSLTILEDLKNATLNDFSEHFIQNYSELKNILRSLYQQSGINKPYTQDTEDWCDIFKNFFDFSIELNHIFERDDVHIKLERVLSSCRELNLHFLSRALGNIFDIIKLGPQKFKENRESLNIQVKEVWLYFSLVVRLNYLQWRSSDKDHHFLNEMKTLNSNRNALEETLKELTTNSLLIKVLKSFSHSPHPPHFFFQEAEKYLLEKDDSDIYAYFVCPDGQYEPNIKMILSYLKNTNSSNNLPEEIRTLAEGKDPLASLLVKFFEEKSDFLYLKLTDFYQLLSGYDQNKDSSGENLIKKVDTFPVVLKNLRTFKTIVQDGNIKKIRAAVQKLIEIPIIPSLQKYRSMVQDISTQLNKSIDLKIIGHDETLDRESLILFQEAFIHIIRNSIDHGIENKSERKKKGKKTKGVIEVYCHQPDSNSIEITIKDDGAGINLEIIKRKALEKEIFSKEKLDQMKEEDILNIIFLPSFSQKDNIDELSGRGVGMDVVKKNVERLGGEITVKSILGKGTEFLLIIKRPSAA